MTRIQGSRDCGNSPKNQFVEDAAIALETGAGPATLWSTEVIWQGIAEDPISGRDAVSNLLARKPAPAEIVIEHAISHGKVGAACGETILVSGQKRRFSHVFEFTSAKADCIATIKSYA